MFKRDVLLAIHNLRELKSIANNAKIRSSLKFLLIRYFILPKFVVYWINWIYTKYTSKEMNYFFFLSRYPIPMNAVLTVARRLDKELLVMPSDCDINRWNRFPAYR